MGKLYGYASGRALGKLEDQVSALTSFGVPEDSLFREDSVTKGNLTPVFDKLLKRLRPGDALVVPSLDCLGDSVPAILERWKALIQTKSVELVVLDLPILSSYNPSDVSRPMVSALVLDIFNYVSEYQRRRARERQTRQIAAAKARGVHMGRTRIEIDPDAFRQAVADWRCGAITATQAAQRLGISQRTFSERVRAAKALSESEGCSATE